MIQSIIFRRYYNLAKIVKSSIIAIEDRRFWVVDSPLYIETSIAHVNFKSRFLVQEKGCKILCIDMVIDTAIDHYRY